MNIIPNDLIVIFIECKRNVIYVKKQVTNQLIFYRWLVDGQKTAVLAARSIFLVRKNHCDSQNEVHAKPGAL
jgi:hypothetical protein